MAMISDGGGGGGTIKKKTPTATTYWAQRAASVTKPPTVTIAPAPPKPASTPVTGGRGSMLPDQQEKAAYLSATAAKFNLTPQELLVYGNSFALPGEIARLQPTVPGGGGGTGAPPASGSPGIIDEGVKMFEWDEAGYQAAGGKVPSWWTAFVPKEVTPETAYGSMLNALIPYLSPQDQVRIAHQLYGMFDTEMSRYKPGYIPEVATITQEQADYMAREGRPMTESTPSSQRVTLDTGETIATGQKKYDVMSEEMRRYLSSSTRAADALTTLSNMREKMVGGDRWKLGAGYKWLQNILGTQTVFGGSGSAGQRRLDYEAQTAAVDPFLSQASSGELAPFGPLGQAVTTPFYSAGMLMPYSAGRYGTPNRRYF